LVAKQTGLLDRAVYDAAPNDVGLDEDEASRGQP
jgi:hypothetical protein